MNAWWECCGEQKASTRLRIHSGGGLWAAFLCLGITKVNCGTKQRRCGDCSMVRVGFAPLRGSEVGGSSQSQLGRTAELRSAGQPGAAVPTQIESQRLHPSFRFDWSEPRQFGTKTVIGGKIIASSHSDDGLRISPELESGRCVLFCGGGMVVNDFPSLREFAEDEREQAVGSSAVGHG